VQESLFGADAEWYLVVDGTRGPAYDGFAIGAEIFYVKIA
jgi:hypothetical protein